MLLLLFSQINHGLLFMLVYLVVVLNVNDSLLILPLYVLCFKCFCFGHCRMPERHLLARELVETQTPIFEPVETQTTTLEPNETGAPSLELIHIALPAPEPSQSHDPNSEKRICLRNTRCRFSNKDKEEMVNLINESDKEYSDSDDESYEPFKDKEFPYETDELESLCGSSDDEANEVFPQFNPNYVYGNVVLELGMEFPNSTIFKQVVRDYNINLGREVRWVKND